MERKKVIIIGGGFGGLTAAKSVKSNEFEIILIDKTNHHLFQPLLYQVATAALSPADIAIPIRSIFAKQQNITVLMDEVISIDKNEKSVHLKNFKLTFDYLIVAAGSRHSYFQHSDWEKNAPGLKTLSDALTIREKIINSLESAEKESDPILKQSFLTFVVVGGGPTGVELAGAIAEIAKKTMIRDYKNFKAYDTNVIIIESFPRILNSFSKPLSEKALNDLRKMGVRVKLNSIVENVNDDYVYLSDGTIIQTKNIIWAAGNAVSPLIKTLDIQTDKTGRAIVEADCSITDNENIFVIGDACLIYDQNGNQLPAIAPAAIQQGKFVGNIISKEIPKKQRAKFHYVDKGNIATIGKAKAVAEIKGFSFYGLPAWLLWSVIHIMYLISFRNRFRVMAEWIWYYFTNRQGTRLIVGK